MTLRSGYKGLPSRLAQLSRFIAADKARATKAGLASGDIDIVVGTHALLAKTIALRDLGLLIIVRGAAFRCEPQGAAEAIAG